ncbi:molybdopterin-dependent oxidoreductase [Rhodococcus sp. 1168]|uniref:molybdopterin-dependent oxidoreductase n=1 Tax=Rhodococcus sp. 1168 TaxID=2018041 RepID=UPI000A0E37B7|nr:molybdopterin-dependent oxidoreductase [Rhodococcus sp. 1168]ORI17042.1 molybdopterin oxidoreductase [Rhodococcus sp. 1168]
MSNVIEKKTFCGICESSCGLIATVEANEVVDLRPDPDHPATRGFACSKGVQFHHVVADPDRVLYPMRRLPDGRFERSTWQSAFDDIGNRLRAIQRTHGNSSIGVLWGNPIAWNYASSIATMGFAAALETKHHYSSASIDVNNYWAAAHIMYGATGVNPLPDFAATDFALIIGANPVVSHGSLVTTGHIREVLLDIPARGGRVVVVDPRRTETAKLFEHTPIRPGADPWLLGAMLRVMFKENLIDWSTVAVQTRGIATLRDLTLHFDLDRAALETGIAAEKITEIARAMATAPRACAYGRCGTSLGQYSTLTKFLLDTLSVVTGNFDTRGGMVFGDPMVDIEGFAELIGVSGRGRWRTRVDGLPEINGQVPLATIATEIMTPGQGQLRALITTSSNFVTSGPGSAESAAALESLDLMVSLDPYITETSKHAHWVLPPALWLEREQMPCFTQAQSTVPNAQWVAPVVPARGEARDDWWIVDQIARQIGIVPSPVPGAQLLGRLGIRFTPAFAVDLLTRIGPYGDLFGLRRGGINRGKLMAHQGAIALRDSCPTGVLRKKIHTHDKRIHLDSAEMLAETRRLVAAQQTNTEFPLRLFSIREFRSHNSWLHNVPKLMAGQRRCRAMINPTDAETAGVHDRDEVAISSPWGRIVVPIEVNEEVSPGSVGLTQGWGHSGGWSIATAAGGASYNDLTPVDPDLIDRPSGNAYFNGIPVAVAAQ